MCAPDRDCRTGAVDATGGLRRAAGARNYRARSELTNPTPVATQRSTYHRSIRMRDADSTVTATSVAISAPARMPHPMKLPSSRQLGSAARMRDASLT